MGGGDTKFNYLPFERGIYLFAGGIGDASNSAEIDRTSYKTTTFTRFLQQFPNYMYLT